MQDLEDTTQEARMALNISGFRGQSYAEYAAAAGTKPFVKGSTFDGCKASRIREGAQARA